jgi:hypothetical protein
MFFKFFSHLFVQVISKNLSLDNSFFEPFVLIKSDFFFFLIFFLVLKVNFSNFFQVISFFRFHDGFTNPVHFNLRWTIYSFVWQHAENGDTMTRSKTFDSLNNIKMFCWLTLHFKGRKRK